MTDDAYYDAISLIDKIVKRMNGGHVIGGRSLHVDRVEMPPGILDEFLARDREFRIPSTAVTLLNGMAGYFYREQNLYLVRGRPGSQQFVGYHDGSDKDYGCGELLPVSECVGFALPITPSLGHYAISAEEMARLSNEED